MVSALKQLGVFEELGQLTWAPRNIRVMDGLTGKQLNVLELGDHFENHFGEPYRVSHRADLHNALLHVAQNSPGVTLKTSMKLKKLTLDDHAAECEFTNGDHFNHSMIIGADGFRSISRRAILNDGPPIFTGHTLFRALIPLDQSPDIPNIGDVHLWLYPKGHVVHYPVSGGRNLNIVAAHEQDWEQKGWSVPIEPGEVQNCFPDATANMQKVLDAPDVWLKWAAAGHPHSETWFKGPATLIGDAIHPTLPYLAQGAAMALEDSVTLAHAIKHDEGFEEYARLRQPRTKMIVETSTRLGKIYHMSGPMRTARNMVIARVTPAQQFKRLSWLYTWRSPKL